MKHARGRFRTAAATLLLLAVAGATFAPTAAGAPGQRSGAGSSQSPACQNDFGTKTPVLLVHGFHEGTDVWASLTKAIQQGIPDTAVVTPFDYPGTQWVTDRDVAPRLADVIGCLANDSASNGGPGKVIIVAHSMGGLAVRCAVSATCAKTAAANPAMVGLEITLGTPNTGSLLATAGNVLSATGQLSCETILVIQHIIQPCPDLLGSLFGANTPAALALESGVNGKPSQAIASLPALPSTVPLDALAGQITVTTSLFQIGPFPIITSQLKDLGDLVVSEGSALDGAPPTSPPHPGTSAKHPGPGSGATTIPCGTVPVGILTGVNQLPGVTCWHNTETTSPVWQAHVLAAIKAAATVLARTPCTAAAMVGAIKAAHAAAQRGSSQWDLSFYACEAGYAIAGIAPAQGLQVEVLLKQRGGSWEVIYGPTEGICLGQPPTGTCKGFKQPIPLSIEQSLAKLSHTRQLPELYVHTPYELGSMSGYPNFASFIGLNNVDYLSGLNWTQVSLSSATATGELDLNNCKPDCVSSTSFAKVQIQLRASHPKQCNVTVYASGNNGPQQETAYVFDQLEVTAVNGTPLPSWLTGPSPNDLPQACG